jgi:hypothetical protein
MRRQPQRIRHPPCERSEVKLQKRDFPRFAKKAANGFRRLNKEAGVIVAKTSGRENFRSE